MNSYNLSESITYSTVRIQSVYKDGSRGFGTGFIINICGSEKQNSYMPIIITNKHVTENSMEFVFTLCKADDKGNPIDKQAVEFKSSNKWIPHPNPDVDLCCLPIGKMLKEESQKGIKVFYIPLEASWIPDQSILDGLYAIEDIYMVGYPIGLSDDTNNKPIVRKGITATHIKNDYNDKKEFMIDCACFPGSSGSPVFIIEEGIPRLNTEGKRTGDMLFPGRVFFLGVLYAGPQFTATGTIEPAHLPLKIMPTAEIDIPINLGYVIKSSEILELEKFFIDYYREIGFDLNCDK